MVVTSYDRPAPLPEGGRNDERLVHKQIRDSRVWLTIKDLKSNTAALAQANIKNFEMGPLRETMKIGRGWTRFRAARRFLGMGVAQISLGGSQVARSGTDAPR